MIPSERSGRRDGPDAMRCGHNVGISSVVAKVDVRPGQKTGVSGPERRFSRRSPTAAAANPLATAELALEAGAAGRSRRSAARFDT